MLYMIPTTSHMKHPPIFAPGDLHRSVFFKPCVSSMLRISSKNMLYTVPRYASYTSKPVPSVLTPRNIVLYLCSRRYNMSLTLGVLGGNTIKISMAPKENLHLGGRLIIVPTIGVMLAYNSNCKKKKIFGQRYVDNRSLFKRPYNV